MSSLSCRPLLVLLACLAGATRGRAQTSVGASMPRDTSAWAAVDRVLGRAGNDAPGGVRRYGFPRTDLAVTIDGARVRPSLALGGWLALRRTGAAKGDAMAMGDLVLREREVDGVIDVLRSGGVMVTALHNHLLRDEGTGRVMYLHVEAHGDAVLIARVVRRALETTATPLDPVTSSITMAAAEVPTVDTAALARALGVSGRLRGGVYQVSVPRRETVKSGDTEVPPAMGVASALNFQHAGDGRTLAAGDLVLRPTEVNAVIDALHARGIAVTGVHSHMLDESPRLVFLHFWGDGEAEGLARALRGALEKTGAKLR